MGTYHGCHSVFAWWCYHCLCSRSWCSLSRTVTIWSWYWLGEFLEFYDHLFFRYSYLIFFYVLYRVISISLMIYLTGHAWGSSVHRRNLPVEDSRNSNISKGALHSFGNFGKFKRFYALYLRSLSCNE